MTTLSYPLDIGLQRRQMERNGLRARTVMRYALLNPILDELMKEGRIRMRIPIYLRCRINFQRFVSFSFSRRPISLYYPLFSVILWQLPLSSNDSVIFNVQSWYRLKANAVTIIFMWTLRTVVTNTLPARKTLFITAWCLSPGDLKILIKRLRSLSSSPRGFSVVLRFIVKSLPFACTPK